jgi:hypothetical protein
MLPNNEELYDVPDGLQAWLSGSDNPEDAAELEALRAQQEAECQREYQYIERLVRALRNAQAREAAFDAEIKRLTTRRDSQRKIQTRAREELLRYMQDTGVHSESFPCGTVTVKSQNPKLVVDSVDALPAECVKVEAKPVMAELNAMWKATKEAPRGCHIEERPDTLQVRT